MGKSVNQIYNEYVKDTPFHLWLSIEKQNFFNKKSIVADENIVAFEKWLNRRYMAGGSEFWERTLNKQISTIEPSNAFDAVIPVLKRKLIMNMTPVTIGLLSLTVLAVSIATISIIRHYKHKK